MSPSNLNAPNLISFTRLLLAFVLFGLLAVTEWWITAAILFVVAVATDAVDGYIARKYQLITVLGRILDPLVDKVIICGAFLFLQNIEGSGVSPWLTLAVVVRELYVTSLRGFYEQQGIDFSASLMGKWKMVLQCVAVTCSLLGLHVWFKELPYFLPFRDLFLILAAAITVYSGYDYTLRGVRLYRAQHADHPPETDSPQTPANMT